MEIGVSFEGSYPSRATPRSRVSPSKVYPSLSVCNACSVMSQSLHSGTEVVEEFCMDSSIGAQLRVEAGTPDRTLPDEDGSVIV